MNHSVRPEPVEGLASPVRPEAVASTGSARTVGRMPFPYALLYATNSIITSVLSTVIGLAIAAPAAYSMTFFRTKRTRGILMWMLSTKMMPAVGALVPIYVLAQKSQLLDTRLPLIIVFTLSNLPIMVWMLYSHFKD